MERLAEGFVFLGRKIPSTPFTNFWVNKLFIIICLSNFSCAATPIESRREKQQEFWPAPPEQARYRYIMSIHSSDDVRLKNGTERFQEILTGKNKPAYILNRPLDIAVKQGIIYLLDSVSPLVHVFDLQRRQYFNFGFRFEGKLSKPVSISVDQNGLVYVADRGRNSIIIYDSFGLYIYHISLDNITRQISGITTDPTGNFIYVVDRGGVDSGLHQVIKFDKQGQLIKRWGGRGRAIGEFNLANDIIMDNQGLLYVLDAGNFRVQVFDNDGDPVRSWGSAGDGLGQFGLPKSISVDAQNNIYVSDAQFGNIQIFTTDGKLLMPIGQLSNINTAGKYSLINGITVDEKGYLYVLDQFYKKLEIFKKIT